MDSSNTHIHFVSSWWIRWIEEWRNWI